MIVLDASAVVELLLGTPAGRRVARRVADEEESLHAPHLLDLEVAQVLRRYVAASVLTAKEAEHALDELTSLDLARYPHDVLLARVWQLRRNATAYDAAYLALAEALSAPLLTCDAKLIGIPGSRATVQLA